MRLGMIGLGRMGANMVRRLLKNGQECVVFDRSPNVVNAPRQRESNWSYFPSRLGDQARPAASYLADGSGGGGR